MVALEEVCVNLRKGNSSEIRKSVAKALEEGATHQVILGEMLEVMEEVGRQFKVNQLFVPEVLIIGRAFNRALDVLVPFLTEKEAYKGIIIIGTVRGDLHNIGKNLVKILMANTGAKVIDLGVDVPLEVFIQAIKDYKPDILAMSALLTTTMVQISETIKVIEKAGLREKIRIIVGGAPVTESYARNIGADYYAKDAGTAAEIVRAHLHGLEINRL